MKLSVIVPVYNTEQYLERCIESIINQTYKDVEIILIDDGSKDRSGEICDWYANKYNHVRVIHRENNGAIEARKEGVRHAQGEVVTFVDSDDWIELDMYEKMMHIYELYSPDIITSGYYVNDSKDSVEYDLAVEGFYDKERIEKEIIPNMMFHMKYNRNGILPSLWNKIYKKTNVENNIFSIDSDVSFGDDAALVYPLIAQANNMYVIGKAWYHYMYNSESMCHACTVDIFKNILVVQKEYERLFDEIGILSVMESQISFCIRSFLEIACKVVYGVDMRNVEYVFPYECVPKGSRVILYGAGVVGNFYWQCLRNQKYATVVAWVDRNYENIRIYNGVSIENPENISNLEFDYVVIAVKDKKVANEIRDYLAEQNIDIQKIIWTNPRQSTENED